MLKIRKISTMKFPIGTSVNLKGKRAVALEDFTFSWSTRRNQNLTQPDFKKGEVITIGNTYQDANKFGTIGISNLYLLPRNKFVILIDENKNKN